MDSTDVKESAQDDAVQQALPQLEAGDQAGEGAPWSTLPETVLLNIFQLLADEGRRQVGRGR